MTKQQAHKTALDVISAFKVDWYCLPGFTSINDCIKEGMSEDDVVDAICDTRAILIHGWNYHHIVAWRYPFLLRKGQKN